MANRAKVEIRNRFIKVFLLGREMQDHQEGESKQFYQMSDALVDQTLRRAADQLSPLLRPLTSGTTIQPHLPLGDGARRTNPDSE